VLLEHAAEACDIIEVNQTGLEFKTNEHQVHHALELDWHIAWAHTEDSEPTLTETHGESGLITAYFSDFRLLVALT
jgi:hypothetical protein